VVDLEGLFGRRIKQGYGLLDFGPGVLMTTA
jgi:hypothetical protein